MLTLGYVILGVAALLVFYIVRTVKPDHLECRAYLIKLFDFTFKLGRDDPPQPEPEPGSKQPGSPQERTGLLAWLRRLLG